MRKKIRFFDMKLFRILYPTFIRPHLEFAWKYSTWESLTIDNIKKIDSSKRRVTKMVTEFRSYRLRENNISYRFTNQEVRRKRGDPFQIYKIVNAIELVYIDMRIDISREEGRRHRYQIERNGVQWIDSKRNCMSTWNRRPGSHQSIFNRIGVKFLLHEWHIFVTS